MSHGRYGFENLLVGDTLAAGASGFFTIVNRNAGTLQVVNTWAGGGTRSLLCQPVASATCEAVKDDIPECSIFHLSLAFRIPAAFTATSTIVQIRRPSAAGLGAAMALQVMVAPLRLRLVDAASAPLFTSATIAADTPLRVEVIGNVGTSITNGRPRLAYFLHSAPTVAVETYDPGAVANIGTTPLSPFRVGRCSGATADTTAIRIDDVEYWTDSDVVGLGVPYVEPGPIDPPPPDPEPPIDPPTALPRQGRMTLAASGLWY